MRTPYLSVVVTSRNDDHGGNLNFRTQLFLEGLAYQANKFQLPLELIFVEWNPPEEAPSLRETLDWPTPTQWCRYRIIKVPKTLHSQFKNSDKLAIYQMIAKNVGIRRAAGEFILSTNIDILFSDELIQFIATRSLAKKVIYRSDRYDTYPDVPLDGSHDERLTYCRGHLLRANLFGGTVHNESFREDSNKCKDESTDGGRAVKWKILSSIAARLVQWKIKKQVGAQVPLDFIEKRQEELRQMGFKFNISRIQREVTGHCTRVPPLHSNACGDFMLMDRDSWFSMKGSPELEMYSLHLDTLTLYVAFASGLSEVQLPSPLIHFHIDHGESISVESPFKVYKKMNQKGIPMLTYGDLQNHIGLLLRRGENVWNHTSWGMGEYTLPESLLEI